MLPRHAGPDAAVAVGVHGIGATSGVKPGHDHTADGVSATTSEYDRTESSDTDDGTVHDTAASIWHDGASRPSSADRDIFAHSTVGYAVRAAATLSPLTSIDGAIPITYPFEAAAAAEYASCVALDGSHRHGAAPHGHSDSTADTIEPGADAAVAEVVYVMLSDDVGGTGDEE